jgi:aconitate hydratase
VVEPVETTISGGFDKLNHRAPNAASGFALSVYPESQPVNIALAEDGTVARLLRNGAIYREAFCGPCFGAGDTPQNGGLSIRHTTRNFPSREGSRPQDGQMAAVALMDARSIAATALNGGRLTAATEIDWTSPRRGATVPFDMDIYTRRVYNGWGKAEPATELVLGPNIKDWPEFPPLGEHILLRIVSFITDDVTTTDELIPSGETSSYRSNPLRLAEFTLSRRDPAYVGRAKQAQRFAAGWKSKKWDSGKEQVDGDYLATVISRIDPTIAMEDIACASAIYARKPGDGSAREQAASCQRVLGGAANFALVWATKRYRSNLLNWGLLPFIIKKEEEMTDDGFVFVPYIANSLRSEDKLETIPAYIIDNEFERPRKITLSLAPLDRTERDILLAGCLINYYKEN